MGRALGARHLWRGRSHAAFGAASPLFLSLTSVRGRGRVRGRQPLRVGGTVATLAAAASVFPLWAPGASAQPISSAPAGPTKSVVLAEAMGSVRLECPGVACRGAVLKAIDLSRAEQGIGPLVLPAGYDSLGVPEQLLVLANLERVDRGLPGLTGLSVTLDLLARSGADTETEPAGPPGTEWGTNWAGGEPNALLADFDWMYDDGPGSPNLDCTVQQMTGCWDHRANILGNYGREPSMGAAATTVGGVTSMIEIFSSAPPGQLAFALSEEGAGSARVARTVTLWRSSRSLRRGLGPCCSSEGPHARFPRERPSPAVGVASKVSPFPERETY